MGRIWGGYCMSLAQLRLKLQPQNFWRREDFSVSPANAEAVRAIDSWPDWTSAAVPGVLAVVGLSGSGKTHLGQIWAHRAQATVWCATDPTTQIDLATLPEGPLFVDDAEGALEDEVLFHLITRAGAKGGDLLLTATRLPAAWEVRLPDLKSRLNAMAVVELPLPDDVILISALRSLFRERNIKASDDLLAYLVRRIGRSIPEARQIVEKLDAASLPDQKPVTRSLARQILDGEPETEPLFRDL